MKKRVPNKKPNKENYVRVFNNPKNVDRAIQMLNEGYSYDIIARELKCEKRSVQSFHERKKKAGMVFTDFNSISIFKSNIRKNKKRALEKINRLLPDEPVNEGKGTYLDYLKTEEEKNRPLLKERMAEAKKTIDEVKKWRRDNGLEEDSNIDTIWNMW